MTEKNKNILETFLENLSHGKFLVKGDKGCENFRGSVAVIDKSKEMIDLERFAENPSRIKKEIKFDDLRGFVAYVNDFKTEKTAIYASRSNLTAIFDHAQKDAPSWETHKISYAIQRSQRWKIWEEAHNRWMAQKDFADFLDTGLNEIVDPTQGAILEMVKNFRATVNFEINSEEAPGGTNFTFSKKTSGGNVKSQAIEIPEYLKIQLEPFENLTVINPQIKDSSKKIPAFELRAKINWRINLSHQDEQSLQFKIQILNFEKAVDNTLESIRGAIAELTECKTYIG